MPRLPRTFLLVVATLAASLLSGCADDPAAPEPVRPSVDTMTIVGLVQDESFAPIADAAVSLRLSNLTTATDEGGLFTFTGLGLGPYVVDVQADGYAPATLTAEPRLNVSLTFVLSAPVSTIPEPVTVHFQGYYECAFEALIIPDSCDFFLDGTGQDLVADRNVFVTGLGPRWSTAVVDVVFEPQPGLDGLRVTLRAKSDADQLGNYEDYGKFHGPQSFSFRVEPNLTLPEGDRPLPANATALELAVYPHGHLWHPAGLPVLGVGAGLNLAFDVFVTVFFVEPAPEGYSLLA